MFIDSNYIITSYVGAVFGLKYIKQSHKLEMQSPPSNPSERHFLLQVTLSSGMVELQ